MNILSAARELKTMERELHVVVSRYFRGNKMLIDEWYQTPNPFLGMSKPEDYIKFSGVKDVYDKVMEALRDPVAEIEAARAPKKSKKGK